MSDNVSWLLQVNVKDGQLDAFRSLMEEMVVATQNEDGTLIYEWFVSDDGGAVHIYERYADSDAVLTHLGSFGANFADRFFALVDPAGFWVYGEPTEAAAQALREVGAQLLGPFGGFAR